MASDTEEQALIDGLRRRDQSAYQKAVRLYSGAMMAAARSMVDPATAEDLVQETWLVVIDAIDGFEGRSALKTWLCTIVANRARNRLRSRKREVLTDFQSPLDPAMEARFSQGGQWSQPTAHWGAESAEALMENEALRNCIDKHVQALPESQRSVLALRDMQGLKSEEVSQIVGLSEGNVRVLLHRARQRIFTMIEGFRKNGRC
ncbi:MAG: RNA polymerase sigma factor [Oleiphilaceae bacterium]|nr:RNA polymerase sigma factor [Oleiphilaceae bacterium]